MPSNCEQNQDPCAVVPGQLERKKTNSTLVRYVSLLSYIQQTSKQQNNGLQDFLKAI